MGLDKNKIFVTCKVTVAKYNGDPPKKGEKKDPVEIVEREIKVSLAEAEKQGWPLPTLAET